MDKKNVTECNEMFESFAQSEYEKKPRGGNSNPITSTSSSARGVHQVNLDTGMAAAIENLTREIKKLQEKLKINLPLIEALQHMPKYTNFLIDLLKRKGRLGEVSSIPLMGDCSAVVLNRVPKKFSDPGVFMIPCLFGSDAMSHALADLGAGINLLLYYLYEKLELGELTSTCMSLSLADRSVNYPRGIIQNLLVKVDKFVFPVDFVVLYMEADEKVPIILGVRSYVPQKRLSICIDSCFDYICGADLVGSNGLVDYDDLVEEESCENDSVCDELVEISGLPEIIEVNEISSENKAGYVEKPAPLELKVLPSHLEYAYLDEGSNLPVIVSSKLTEEQKTKLIEVLKLHKGAMETFRYSRYYPRLLHTPDFNGG
ncbi:uncharacterized protein LOC143592937 [Bidens hawaiensis]|uniref:uncharacterized protein LOC143592937 n=1 Tax=Bidens hawaiensis TaxID=980011 RepID=UPI00404AA761